MKTIVNQLELKYIVLNNIQYKAKHIRKLEIDGTKVSFIYQKHIKDKIKIIEGDIYHLDYIFEK